MAVPDPCCTCLSTDRHTFPLGRLSFTYRLLSEATSPNMRVCWECRAVLDRLRRFRLQVSQAQYFMQRLSEHGLHLRGKSLSHLEVQTISTYDVEYEEVEIDPDVDFIQIIDMPEDIDDGCVTTGDERQDKLYFPSTHSEDECNDSNQRLIEFVSVGNQDEAQSKTTLDYNTQNKQNLMLRDDIIEESKTPASQPIITRSMTSSTTKSKLKDDRHKLPSTQDLSILNRDENQFMIPPKCPKQGINGTIGVLKPIVLKPPSNVLFKVNKQNIQHSVQPASAKHMTKIQGIGSKVNVLKQVILKPPSQILFKVNKQDIRHSLQSVSAKRLTAIQLERKDDIVHVVVLNTDSNIVLNQNKQPSIECVIINNLHYIQLENTLNLLTRGKQVSVLKEITLKRSVTLPTLNKIKNKLLTLDDMLGAFGNEWLLQLTLIQAANQKPISLKQWLSDKAKLKTTATTSEIIPIKPVPALNRKQEILKSLSPVSSPISQNYSRHIISEESIECIQAEEVHSAVSESQSIHTMSLNQNVETVKPSSAVSNQLDNETIERQLITNKRKNKNILLAHKTNKVEVTRVNSALQIVYSEEPEVHENLVVLGSRSYDPNIPIALTDDENEQDGQDDGIGYQDDRIGDLDDETVRHVEDIEITNHCIAMLEKIKTETDDGCPKKGKPDEAILDLLDPMDQFGVHVTGRSITYQAIALMMAFLKEGKVKSFKVNLRDIHMFRYRLMKQFKSQVCKFCCVRIDTNLAKHVRKYHTDAAGPHVCAICSRHFLNEQEQRAHYQRHFYMYKCMTCKRSIYTSIWRMVLHIQRDESKARRIEGIIVPKEVKVVQPRVDDATIATLDALDRFGMRITYRKINDVKKHEEDGKVERFFATLSELMAYRKVELHSYGKVNKEKCFMCIVRIPDEKMEEHMRLHHSEAAGPHVCAICSCHFRTEEARSAHYQRHFNMYRCRVGDCRYATPSIKKIWSHVYRKEKGLSVNARVFDGTCDICGGLYINPTSFRDHYEEHTSKETYECDICGKVFKTRRKICAHLFKHNKKFMCEQCGYRTNNKNALQDHTMSHKSYEERHFVCSFCNKRFTTKTKLRDHEARHGEKTLLCAYCEVMFTSKDDLSHHVKLKHPENVVPTRRMKEVEPRTKSVFRNLPLRSSASYSCNVCKKEFKNNALLKQHLFVHTKELPYKCIECKKSFGNKTSLDIHLISHSGETPYACDKCEKRYSTYKGLKSHEYSKHADITYECTMCGLKFRYPNKLKKHMSMKHSAQSIIQNNEMSSANIKGENTDQDIVRNRYEMVEQVAQYEIVAAPGHSDNTGSESEGDLKKTPWINEEALRQERTAHIMAASSETTQEDEEIIYKECEIPAEPAQHRVYRDVQRLPTGAFVRSKRAWEQAALQDRHRGRGKTARLSEHDPYPVQRGCSDPKIDWDSIIPEAEADSSGRKAYGGKTGWKSDQVVHQEPRGSSVEPARIRARGQPRSFKHKAVFDARRPKRNPNRYTPRSQFGGKYKPGFLDHMPLLE